MSDTMIFKKRVKTGAKLQVEAGDPLGNFPFVIAVIQAELLFAKFFFIRGDVVIKEENTNDDKDRDQGQSYGNQENIEKECCQIKGMPYTCKGTICEKARG
jgi:hypothetical protein